MTRPRCLSRDVRLYVSFHFSNSMSN
jgi:hypothetical protein